MAAPFRVLVSRKNQKTGKTYWTRIGVAFKRDNGGMSVQLDALPLTGDLLIVPPDEKEETPPNPDADDVPY